MRLVLTTNSDVVAADWVRGGRGGSLIRQTLVAATAIEIAARRKEIIFRHTPFGRSDPGQHLNESIETDPMELKEGGTTLVLTTRMTKRITIHGEQVPLAAVLESGHQAFEIVPVNKQALWYEGADHPFAHAKIPAAAPNRFLEDARREIIPVEQAMLAESNVRIVTEIVKLMKAP